ncbi:helix-turn-helix domain-containing protein [Bifidobacterium sp. SMB2]|uniref:Helix-turn-helix domain-containing protein n=1 Tax=Bifidobacterium saimiriisciurei TaxID=2661627 RepID=A0ABX0C8P7_9BIFI|nr:MULTISPECIES: IclR family transcriptional regulator [Bifidobacterium]NEG96297.1 helix-turn-helix domain-containing protein [Bifidobacterium sp. SMB2]NEH11071.1 helix-turn-helix domain-containing protein [Bifidobacterium saimiriisciurei]
MAENTAAPSGTRTLIHGIEVIRSVANGAASLREVVEATGLSRSTAHRLIQALRIERFLRENSDGSLLLGPALIELGFQALNSVSLQAVAHPILLDLAQRAKDTIHLAVEDSGMALYLDKIHGTRGIEIRSWPGCRMPLTYTGIGKALLLDSPDRWRSQYIQDRNLTGRDPEHDYADESAFSAAMAKFARQGFAYDLEENEPGIRCVSAPVRDGRGKTVAAISVSGAIQFMPPKRMRALGPVVVDAASRISAELGYKTAANENIE